MKRSELKEILLEAYVELLREQEAPAQEKPKKFIPQRVKSTLGKTINMLFGSSHTDFIDKIQLVVPKPSEFQVFLKNGQTFYLKWVGKPDTEEGAFEAKIEGKKYYLGTTPGYEQALDKLGDILRNGPITQGEEPGGEEFAATPEEPASETGGEFPEAGAEETAPETGFEEETPEAL